jgi:CDP-diacylglycerol--glycerol-3-phosphate 3-phosphatidyltransferase
MASIYDLKPAFQRLLRPIVRWLARIGATPNQVTIAALLLSVGLGALIAFRPDDRRVLILLAPFLLVRMALNAVDGVLAREHGMKSTLGAFLNELGDVASDAALYLPLALVPGFKPALVVIAVVLSSMSEMAGVVAAQLGASRRYDGPMGKSDRALVFGALGLAVGLGVPTGRWLDIWLVTVVGLLAVTILNRVRRGLAEIGVRSLPPR